MKLFLPKYVGYLKLYCNQVFSQVLKANGFNVQIGETLWPPSMGNITKSRISSRVHSEYLMHDLSTFKILIESIFNLL